MFSPSFQPDFLGLLNQQNRYYVAELGRTHQVLSKLYRKLAKVERALSDYEERRLSRKDKKRLVWTRSISQNAVLDLETQQANLRKYLRQCNELIASYGTQVYGVPHASRTAYPSTLMSPISPVVTTPWSAVCYPPGLGEQAQPQERPKYWDLSMLRERRRSSPFTASADSEFYEPAIYSYPFGQSTINDPYHVFAHEQMSPVAAVFTPLGQRSKKSSMSERDDLPEITSPVSPTKLGAEGAPAGPRKRSYSENTIQLIERRLGAPTGHQRGNSAGVLPTVKTTVSEALNTAKGSIVADTNA